MFHNLDSKCLQLIPIQNVSVESIQEVVAKYFNINAKDLKSSKRSNDLAYPRQIAMYLCRDIAQMQLARIGECFGKRDHTTVMHACRKIELYKY